MKYIKEFSDYSKKFEPDEVRELKDVYNDIVDDLDLYDHPHQILNVDDSCFREYKTGDIIKIWIRTIVTERTSSVLGGKMLHPLQKELDYHESQVKKLEGHIQRLRNMGYVVNVKDLLTGDMPSEFHINGVIIEITKS